MRSESRCGYRIQVLSRRLEVAKQVSVDPLTRIESFAMRVEVFTRFNRQDERPELVTDTVQALDEAVILSPCASNIGWESKTGVYVHLGRVDKNQDGGNTLIPK